MFKDGGVSATAALVCMSLYIRQLVRERGQDVATPFQASLESQQYTSIMSILAELKENQKVLLEHLGSLMSSGAVSLNIGTDLSQDTNEIKTLTNSILQDLKMLAANQLNLMSGFQKVIEQLIDALRRN
jgi:hypothetical protein